MEDYELLPYDSIETVDQNANGYLTVENGMVFSVYTDRAIIESSFDPAVKIKGRRRGIPIKYVQECIKKATHMFMASAKVRNRNTGVVYLMPLTIAYVSDHENESCFTLELIVSTSRIPTGELSERCKLAFEFEQKYPKELFGAEGDHWGDLEAITQEFKNRGFDYQTWREDLDFALKGDKTQKVYKLGLGIIMIREMFKYFLNLGRTSSNLYAANDYLIEYYEKLGFAMARPGSTCKNPEFVQDSSKAENEDLNFYMLLCDLQDGYDAAETLAKKYTLGFPLDAVWKALDKEREYFSAPFVFPTITSQ